MHKIVFFPLLITLSNTLFANDVMLEVNKIESQWAKIYYGSDSSNQKKSYPLLLKYITNLLKEQPNAIELSIWQAIITSTNAEFESPLSALKSIGIAKKLLESTLKKDPFALEGTAFVVLGTLYSMAPGWPISFGSQKMAKKLLKKELK